jgi:uncharacterized protein (TIGR02001 family)
MLTSIRSLLAATTLAGTLFAAAPAMAQEEESAVSLSANVAIVSEYHFRGVDLSGGNLAIQGGIDAALPAGFYVGTWASSLDEDTVGFGHTELDIYGGWGGEFGGLAVDVGVIAYLYPDAGAGDFDAFEGYASVGGSVGPASIEVGIAYAPEQDGLGGTDNFYGYTDVGFGLPGTPVTLTGHVGYTDGFLTYTADSKAWDWSIGADLALGEVVTLGAMYTDAEGGPLTPGGYDFVDDAFLVSLSASF